MINLESHKKVPISVIADIENRARLPFKRRLVPF